MGSPLYWAPEQSSTAAVGPPADVYSLAGLAYFTLSGTPMFTARPAVIMVYAHLHEAPEPLSKRCPELAIPRRFDEVMLACAAKKPADRPTAAQVAAELGALRESPELTAARRWRASPCEPAVGPVRSDERQPPRAGVHRADPPGRGRAREYARHEHAHVEQLQTELESRELDLAMLTSDSQPSSKLPEVSRDVERLHAASRPRFASSPMR